MDGYTYEVSQDQLCRNLIATLRDVAQDEDKANMLAWRAAVRSDGSPYEFERILRGYIDLMRIETDLRNKSLEDCTCLPLDGGLGATTCPACKRTVGNNEIQY